MDRDRAADLGRIAALTVTGVLIAALAATSLVMTLSSPGDLEIEDVLLGAMWLSGLAMFSAGCLLRVRKHLAAWRASDAGSSRRA